MNDQEWAAFSALLDATFRGGLDESREAALRLHFGRVDLQWGERCVRDLTLREQVWVPTSGELVASLRRLTGGGWHFRRILAGREIGEQEEADAERLQDHLDRRARRMRVLGTEWE